MICKNCEKEVKEGMAFCPYCGTEVAPEPEPEPKKFYCPSCKNEIEPDMLFCPCCGYEISENERQRFVQSSSEDVGLTKDIKYCVVITGSRNGPLPLIALIRKKTGLNLSMSKKLAENLPFPLFSDLTEDEANSIVIELGNDGIVGNVQDQSFFTPKATVNSGEQTKNKRTQTDMHFGKREKLKTATVLSAVGAVLSVIVAVCILLLPLFTTTYSETINGETVYKEKSISMLVFVIESVKSISSISNTSSFAYLGWLYLFLKFVITIAVVSLIVSSVKLSVEKLKNLIKFEEYSKNELSKNASARSAEDLVKTLKGAAKGNQLFQVIMDLGLIIFIFGYGTVVWGTIIAIVIMASVAYAIEKTADWIKKKALA